MILFMRIQGKRLTIILVLSYDYDHDYNYDYIHGYDYIYGYVYDYGASPIREPASQIFQHD